MEEKKPLSQYGVGPYYAATVFTLTLGAILWDRLGTFEGLRIPEAEPVMGLLSALCIGSGAALWLNAVVVMRIDQRIRRNELATTGAYAWVRNPIYSAIMLVMWGLLLWNGDLLLLLLCPLHYLLMTVMVKHTEEKWLADLYGEPYLDYCRRVNRCIPWPPRQKGGR